MCYAVGMTKPKPHRRPQGRRPALPKSLQAVQQELDALTQPQQRTRLRGTSARIRYSSDTQRHARWGVFWNEYDPQQTTGRPKQRAKFFVTEEKADTFCDQLCVLLERKAAQERALRAAAGDAS